MSDSHVLPVAHAQPSAAPCVPCMDKLDRLGWVAQRNFEIGDRAIGIRTTSLSFASWLDRALGAYRTSEEPAPSFSVVVGDRGNGASRRDLHIVYRGSESMVRTENMRVLRRALLDELTAQVLHERDDAIYLAAAPVSRGGRTALISSTFVSTLAGTGRRAARRGLALPASAWVAVEPGTATLVPASGLPGVDGDMDVRSENGGAPQHLLLDEPRTVDLILLQAPGPGGVRPMSAAESLYRLAGSAINLRALGADGFEGLVPLVRSAATYAIARGNEILSVLEDVLSGEPASVA